MYLFTYTFIDSFLFKKKVRIENIQQNAKCNVWPFHIFRVFRIIPQLSHIFSRSGQMSHNDQFCLSRCNKFRSHIRIFKFSDKNWAGIFFRFSGNRKTRFFDRNFCWKHIFLTKYLTGFLFLLFQVHWKILISFLFLILSQI